MLPLTGGGELVGGRVLETDNRGGTHLTGAIEGTGPVQGVRGGDGGRIYGGAQYDSAWESGRGATELEYLGHGGRAAYISHGIPSKGRPAELPSGGMTRPSGDEDGDAGTFPTPACPGHRGHYGGGKTPPTHGVPDATCWSPGRH